MLHCSLHIRPTTLPTVALLGLLSMVGGTVLATPAAAQTAAETGATAHKLHVVLMKMDMKTVQFVFEPKTVVAHVGDTIEWEDKDIYQHTVTSIHGKTLNSGIIGVGKTWSYKAVKAGTFPYYCTLHPNMKGTLIVR